MVTTDVGQVTVITLEWPERRNAVGPEEVAEVADAIGAASGKGSRGLVVTGHGAFCAGGDLPAIMALVKQGPDVVRDAVYGRFQRLPRTILSAPVPVFAAVDGPAVGLGMDLALMCDDRFIGPKGWLRQGWGALGLVPGTGGELLLRRLAPNLIWQLLGSGEKIDGVAAEHYGLGRPCSEPAIDTAVAAMDHLVSSVPADALAGYAGLHRAELLREIDGHLAACLDFQVGLLTSSRFAEQAERLLSGG